MLKKYTLSTFLVLVLSLMVVACGANPTVEPTATKLVHTEMQATNTPAVITTPPATTTAATIAPTVAPPTKVITTIPTTTHLSLSPVDRSTTFSGTLALAHVKELASKIGIRAVGTPGHELGADYLEGYFKQLGLKVERPIASFEQSDDKGSYLSYTGTDGQPVILKGNAVNYSGSAKVSGPLVYVGIGMDGQIPANSLKGKIALIMRGQISFNDKVQNAKKAGAIGIAIYNNVQGELDTATLGTPTDLPVVGLSDANGTKLRQLLDSNKNDFIINLETRIVTDKVSISNVIGVRPASKNPATAPVIIIGGHYDSVPAGPGANDNASGTAVTLELAHVLQNQYHQYEFRFIGFGGEEIGLVGSGEYVKNLSAEERKRVVAMINIDMVTVGSQLYIGGSPDLTKLAFGAANEVGAGDVQGLPADLNGASDHASFAQAGIPVLFLNRENDPNYHRAGDTTDKVLPDRLEQIGNIVIKVIDKINAG